MKTTINRMPIESPKILKQFNVKEISHLKANANYTYLFGFDGTKALSAYSLKAFQKLMEAKDFIKIDRSNLVKHSFIKRCVTSEGREFLELKDFSTIAIPRRKGGLLRSSYLSLFI